MLCERDDQVHLTPVLKHSRLMNNGYIQSDIIVNYRVTASTFHNNLGLNVINPQLTVGQGLGIEIIMTFTLVFVVMATTDPDRTDGGNTAVAVGLTVAGLNLTGVRSLYLKHSDCVIL